MKKTFVLTVILTVALCIRGNGFAATYGGGDGTTGNPYQISTPQQMNLIGANPGDWGACFKLMADIDMSIYTGAQYNIIGNNTTQFTGTFDGNGHIIKNLTYTTTSQVGYVGLFGVVGSNTKLENVNLENVNISSGGSYIGGLCAVNHGTISRSSVTGTITANGAIGGLCGYSTGVINQCYTSCSITGVSDIGGLVGVNWGLITACHASGVINGSSYIGGLVGINYGHITSCYASNEVSGTQGTVGGLVGDNSYNSPPYTGTITTCYAIGSVGRPNSPSPGDRVGGLCGRNYSGIITQCYAAAIVWGDHPGGLCGENSGTISQCLWDMQTSMQVIGVLGYPQPYPGTKGKLTAEMKKLSTFTSAGWDFENVWFMPQDGYPQLIPPTSTLTIKTIPSFVTSVSPAVGQNIVYCGLLDVRANTFANCPDVYQFDHWEGGVNDPNLANTTVLINGDKTITAIFTLAAPVCGDQCHPNFTTGDLNHDCYVDIQDFAILSSRWMNCTHPACD